MTRVLLVLGLWTVSARAGEVSPRPEPELEAKRILTGDGYAFCRDNDAPMPARFRDWCDVGWHARTCPQIQQMCDRPLEVTAGPGGDPKRVEQPPVKGEAEPQQAPSWDFPSLDLSLPGWLEWVFWAFVGLVVGTLLILLAWLVSQRRSKKPLPEDKSEAQGVVELIEAESAEVEELLRLAREAAATDVVRACMLLYSAALKRLEEQGIIRRERSTTNREYLRQMRGKTPLDGPVGSVAREVERAKFGRSTPTPERFQALYDAIAPALSRLSVLALVLWGACRDPDLEGRRVFTKLIEERGVATKRLAKGVDDVDAKSPPVLVDSRTLRLDAATLESIERGFLGGGRYLVVLNEAQELRAWPSIRVKSVRAHLTPRDVDEVDDASPDGGAADGGVADAGSPDAGGPAAGPVLVTPIVEEPMLITCAGDFCESVGVGDVAGRLPAGLVLELPPAMLDAPEVLLEAEGQPFAVRWRSERGILVLVADRRLFANGAMAVPGNATLAVALAESLVDRTGLAVAEVGAAPPAVAEGGAAPPAAPVEADGEGNADERAITNATVGFADPPTTPVDSLARSGFLILILQVLAASITAFLARGMAFGTLRDRRRERRRSFREHVEALGLQLMHRRGSRLAASMYAAWVLERLRHRLGLRSELHDIRGLSEQLAARLGDQPAVVRETLEMADAVRREPRGIAVRERDLVLVRRLGTLLSRLQEQAHTRA